MLEQVNEYRGARSHATALDSRPQLIRRPPDKYRAFARFEPVFIGDRAPMTGRRVQLEFVASTVHTHDLGCGDARTYDVWAAAEPVEFRLMCVERFAGRASAQLGG